MCQPMRVGPFGEGLEIIVNYDLALGEESLTSLSSFLVVFFFLKNKVPFNWFRTIFRIIY